MIPTPSVPAGTSYQLWLSRDDGTRLKKLDTIESFSYTRALNFPGAFQVTLPPDFDRTLIAEDRRILVWRKPPGGARSLDFCGLIRGWNYSAGADGRVQRVVRGRDLTYLLSGRVVAYSAGSAQADQADYADDMLKAIAAQNLGSSATAARQISSTYFSVAGDASAGPSLTKAFSYRNVLDVMKEIAEAARQAGTETYFQIEPTTETAFEFRTYTGQPGHDRTSDAAGGLTFGLEFGNLSDPALDYDAEAEVNFAYGLGQGEGSDRNVQTGEDTTRSGASLFARREAAAQSSNESTDAGVADAADATVNAGRPQLLFTATLLSVPGSVYGLDWGFGDRVTVSFDGLQFDALVRAVNVNVDRNGQETVTGALEAYL